MRIDGTLAKWNDDRGFGFIAPAQGGHEIFVHISAFPRDDPRPQVGELLSFEIETAKDGKKRAKAVSRPGRANAIPVRHRQAARPREKRNLLGRAVPLIILIALGTYGYGEYSRRFGTDAAGGDTESTRSASSYTREDSSSSFRCDGRTYCSQMTSCAEAKFFLKNCPGVKMDGNNDGVPCEQQWCTNPFAK
jgi:cold shock CspA family protein